MSVLLGMMGHGVRPSVGARERGRASAPQTDSLGLGSPAEACGPLHTCCPQWEGPEPALRGWAGVLPGAGLGSQAKAMVSVP